MNSEGSISSRSPGKKGNNEERYFKEIKEKRTPERKRMYIWSKRTYQRFGTYASVVECKSLLAKQDKGPRFHPQSSKKIKWPIKYKYDPF